MKIFSNFDSERKKEAYKEIVEKYGEENVLVLNKSFLLSISITLFLVKTSTKVFPVSIYPIYLYDLFFINISIS